jgi:hypothetical protein
MKFKYAKVISVVLFVLVSLFIPLGLYANWFKVTIGDQERFVETFSPLAANPQIQDSVRDATYVFIDSVDIQGALEENLPEVLMPASKLLAAGAKITLINLADRLIYSDQFANAWQAMAAATQKQLLMVLTGDTTGFLKAEEEGLYITLDPIKNKLIERVSETPALGFVAFKLKDVELPKIEVLNGQQLKFVQLVWTINTHLSVYIWPIIIIMLIFAVYAYGNYFRAATIAGFSIVVGSLLSLLSIELIKLRLQAGLSDGFYGKVIGEIFTQMTLFLRNSSFVVLAIGIAVVIISLVWQFIYNRKLRLNEEAL